LINFVTGFAALAYFMMIAAATKQHFNSDKYPMGMFLISTLSLIGVSTFMAFAFLFTLRDPVIILALIAVAFTDFYLGRAA
jgi:hypothetical protein